MMYIQIIQAVAILNNAAERLVAEAADWAPDKARAYTMLCHAIRHLSRPDRDVYPKSRRGSKVRPVYGRDRSPWQDKRETPR